MHIKAPDLDFLPVGEQFHLSPKERAKSTFGVSLAAASQYIFVEIVFLLVLFPKVAEAERRPFVLVA